MWQKLPAEVKIYETSGVIQAQTRLLIALAWLAKQFQTVTLALVTEEIFLRIQTRSS